MTASDESAATARIDGSSTAEVNPIAEDTVVLATEPASGSSAADATMTEDEDSSASSSTAKNSATDERKSPAPDAVAAAGNDPSGLLGAAVWLMLSSPGHKHLFVTDFEWLVVPPILAKQFRLYRRDNVPIGFVSWARLDDEAETRIINGSVKLSPNEWTGGDKFWIIDVIAPFGGVDDMMKDLKESVFKDETVKYIQADENGRRVEVLK